MALDTVIEILYDGEIIVSVGTKEFVVHRTAVEKARINGKLIDVTNIIGKRINDLEALVRCGSINPYKEALCSGEEVYKAIAQKDRRGMNRKDISTVLDAVMAVAVRSVQ